MRVAFVRGVLGFLRQLHLLPQVGDLVRVVGAHVPEHMGMATNHLLIDRRAHVVYRERPGV